MIGYAILVLIPLLTVLSRAISDNAAVNAGRVGILPVGFQLDSIRVVLLTGQFRRSFLVSLYLVVVGTVSCLVMTALTAYVMSKKHLPLIKGILILYIFVMLFRGGIIPDYLLVRSLGMINTLGSLIFPRLIFVFYMLILKSFFESIPESLEESAKLDGASNLRILFSVVVPVALPAIATISLFYGVQFWNGFFDALLYITVPRLKPLQVYLREVIAAGVGDLNVQDLMLDESANLSTESVQAATVIVSIIPMLIVYPWIQRYFIKGILIGSVKG